MLFKVNERLSFNLPTGYDYVDDYDDDGERNITIKVGPSVDEDGDTSYEQEFKVKLITPEGTSSQKSALDVLEEEADGDVNLQRFNGPPEAMLATRTINSSILGVITYIHVTNLYVALSHTDLVEVTTLDIGTEDIDSDKRRRLFDQLKNIWGAMKICDKKAIVGNLDMEQLSQEGIAEFKVAEENSNALRNTEVKQEGRFIEVGGSWRMELPYGIRIKTEEDDDTVDIDFMLDSRFFGICRLGKTRRQHNIVTMLTTSALLSSVTRGGEAPAKLFDGMLCNNDQLSVNMRLFVEGDGSPEVLIRIIDKTVEDPEETCILLTPPCEIENLEDVIPELDDHNRYHDSSENPFGNDWDRMWKTVLRMAASISPVDTSKETIVLDAKQELPGGIAVQLPGGLNRFEVDESQRVYCHSKAPLKRADLEHMSQFDYFIMHFHRDLTVTDKVESTSEIIKYIALKGFSSVIAQQVLNVYAAPIRESITASGYKALMLFPEGGTYVATVCALSMDQHWHHIKIDSASGYCPARLLEIAEKIYESVTFSNETDEVIIPEMPLPDEMYREHYELIRQGGYTTRRDADFVGQPIRVLMEKCGNKYDEAYEMMEIEEDDYSLDQTALRIAKVFRMDEALFDPYEDTEALIRLGAFKNASMLHALRSLAWTAMDRADRSNRTLDQITFDELETIGERIKKLNYIHYGVNSYCSGLCSCYDWRVFYVPDEYRGSECENQTDLRDRCGKENRSGNTSFLFIPGMNDLSDMHRRNQMISRNEETLESLEALRHDLILLEPVMQTIHDGFMKDRDRSEALEGPLADALTAWCALCVAAKEPFYSEEASDSPEVDAGLELPLERPDDDMPVGKVSSAKSSSTKGSSSKKVSTGGNVLDLGGKTVIEAGQFNGNMSLKNIIIPEGVTEIKEQAFSYCMQLESVVFPKSLRKIGNSAFSGCRALKRVELQEGVREIGDFVFGACSSLLRVDLPDSLEKVERCMFGLGGDSPYATAYLSGETAKRLKDVYARRLVIDGKGYDSIRDYLGVDYWGNPVNSYSEPERDPEQDAREWMEEFGQYVTHNPDIQFEGKLFVFTGFGGSSDMDDPLVQAVMQRGGQHRKSISGKTDYLVVDPAEAGNAKPRKAVEQIQNGGHIQIILKNDVEAALTGRKHAQSTAQQPQAADKQKNNEPKPQSTAKSVRGNRKTERCVPANSDECEIDILDCLTKYYGSEPRIILPSGIKSIGTDAFLFNKTLISIVIPEGVESIEDDAFYGCEALESVILPKSLTELGSKAFYDCKKLRTIAIPDGCDEIGDEAFNGCESLENVTLPDYLARIGDGAFSDCKSLRTIAIPNGCEKVSDGAFSGCEVLESVTLPNSIESIGSNAFFGCDQLRTVYIPEGCGDIGSDAFCSCSSLTDIYVPDSVYDISPDAFQTFNVNTVIHTVRGSEADTYAKENELEVKYDYTSNAASKKNVPATVSAPAASTDEDQALLDEIAAITAMLEEDVASDRETEVSGSQDEKANVSADFETILYMILNNEAILGKLNRNADTFWEIYEDDFSGVSKSEVMSKRSTILRNKNSLDIPAAVTAKFKACSVEERFRISTGNLFSVDPEIDFEKKAKMAIERTKKWYEEDELEEVKILMQIKLESTRKEIDEQYDAIRPAWKSFEGAKKDLHVYLEDKGHPERDDTCVFQKEHNGVLCMIKMVNPELSILVVRLINCMAWYWNATPQQIWEQALRNDIIDNRTQKAGSAMMLAQDAYRKAFNIREQKPVVNHAEEQRRKEQEAQAAREKQQKEAKIRDLENQIRALEQERDSLKGLFKGGKRRKIQEQIDELQRELRTLRR